MGNAGQGGVKGRGGEGAGRHKFQSQIKEPEPQQYKGECVGRGKKKRHCGGKHKPCNKNGKERGEGMWGKCGRHTRQEAQKGYRYVWKVCAGRTSGHTKGKPPNHPSMGMCVCGGGKRVKVPTRPKKGRRNGNGYKAGKGRCVECNVRMLYTTVG